MEESYAEADRVRTLEALALALLKAESLNAQEVRDVTGLDDAVLGSSAGAARTGGVRFGTAP